MAVVSVQPLWEGEGGSDNIQRKREYTLIWEVLTDDPNDDTTVAGGPQARALGLPGNGSVYPFDAYATCVGLDPARSSESPTRWIVPVKYSSDIPRSEALERQSIDPSTGQSTNTGKEPLTGANKPRADNPLDRPATYKITHESCEEVMDYCLRTGEPILNCADLPYDPPPMREMFYAIATVTKNLAIVEFDWLELFINSVNSAKWNNRAVRTCRILAIDYEPASENNFDFWKVMFRIKIKPQKWDRLLPEVGFYEKIPDGTYSDGFTQKFKLKEIDEPKGSGIKPDKPYRLNGYRATTNGGLAIPSAGIVSLDNVIVSNDAGSGDPPIAAEGSTLTSGRGQRLDAPNTTLVYTRWRDYPEKAFSLLGL